MLPYAPLHHLLLADAGAPLVLTSGNVSDEPIAFRDDDALRAARPRSPTPCSLHDRPIHTRTDDSVARVVRGRPAAPAPLARARARVGGAPRRVPARRCSRAGRSSRARSAWPRGARAWVGHHIGDLRNAETLTSFREGIAHFEGLFDVPRRSSRTTCTRTTSRRPTRSSARAWSSSACSTTTRTSPRAWPSTASRRPRSGRSTTAPATAPTGRPGAARSCSATCAPSRASAI